MSATHHDFGMRASASWLGDSRGALWAARRAALSGAGYRQFAAVLSPEPATGAQARHAWLEGIRCLFAVDNIFGSASDVHDRFGVVPDAYQRGYLDPFGRAFRLSIRKGLQ